MNSKKSKSLTRAAEYLAAEWYKTVLPEAEVAKLSREKVRELDRENFEYIYDMDGSRILPAYCIKSFKKSLKKAYKEKSSIGS